MCLGIGASSGSKVLNKEAGGAYATAINQASTEFGDANKVFNDIVQSTAPIAAAGPDQTGYSAQAESAINAATIDQTAAQYKNASAAVKSDIAAQGGGNIALPSGVNIATEEALAEAGAQQTASGLRENTINNYEKGNENWKFAEGALSKAPGVFDTANTAMSDTAKLGDTALKSQDVINAAPSWQKIAMGALGTGLNFLAPGAGTILGGGIGGPTGGDSSSGGSGSGGSGSGVNSDGSPA
jgi:hypothetical protein